MTDRGDNESTRPGATSPAPRPPGATRFVVVFVVLVLGQLTAYRFAIETPLNDWYLFQVARHTSWTLGWVGHEATLEKESQTLNPVAVRAQLHHGSVPEAMETPPQPLSALERWQFRAYTERNSSRQSDLLGPRVTFILKPGIHYRIQALESKLRDLEKNAPTNELNTVQDALSTLQQEVRLGLQDPELRNRQRGRQFTFFVIPACGAIEVMAIFLAAVLAFPTRWQHRVWGVALGLPVLYGVNIARLACLGLIGALDNGGPWFSFIHEYVWQAVYIIFVVVLWLIWLELFVRRRP